MYAVPVGLSAIGDVTVPLPITRFATEQMFGEQSAGLLCQVESILHKRLPLTGDVLYPTLQFMLKLVPVWLGTVGATRIPFPIARVAREQVLGEQSDGLLLQLPSGLHSRDPVVGEVPYPTSQSILKLVPVGLSTSGDVTVPFPITRCTVEQVFAERKPYEM